MNDRLAYIVIGAAILFATFGFISMMHDLATAKCPPGTRPTVIWPMSVACLVRPE